MEKEKEKEKELVNEKETVIQINKEKNVSVINGQSSCSFDKVLQEKINGNNNSYSFSREIDG
jgi:hypothetical protein